MREIKFRAWDKVHMCWFKPTYDASNGKLDELLIRPNDGRMSLRYINGIQDESLFVNRFLLQQYTGLKDKNGVEIYEGDIVASSSMPNSPIEYQRGAFNGIYDDGSHDEWEAPLWRYTVEVIGNIYENPELLEVTL